MAEERKDGVAGTAERLPAAVNSGGSESNPLIGPDESFLIVSADRPGGLGGGDLYVSHRRDGQWTDFVNLGPVINSPYLEFAPALSPDGRYLFFTSERPGAHADRMPGRRPGDIYR